MDDSKTPFVFFHDADVVERDERMLGPIAQTYDVTVPQYPGFEGYFDVLDREWEQWDNARDIAAYFRKLFPRGQATNAGGAGLGAWVALELALMSPERLTSLVLVAPYGVKLRDRLTSEFADILLLDPEEQLELGWADSSRARGLRMPGYPASGNDMQHELAFAERATLARYVWKPFLYSPHLKRWLGEIDVPTLVVAGAEDRMIAEGHSQDLAALLPNAQYVEIPDAGHYPYLEQPEAFADAVSAFHSQLRR